MKSEEDCMSILYMLTNTTSWNPHALFFVYVDGQVVNWQGLVTFIIEQFWEYFVINLTVSIPHNPIIFLKVNMI